MGLVFNYTTGALQWALESTEDICSLFPNGVVLRKPGTCGYTITCQNGISTQETNKCPTNSFKLDTQKCGAATDAYCSTPCVKASPQWLADVKNCHDWVKCDGKTELARGTCPSGQVFNSKENRCHYPTNGEKCDKVFDICSVAPKDQKFWDPNNCHKYITCDKSQKQVSGVCDQATYYDKRTGTCIAKSQVDCYKHPYPENVCGTTKLAIRDRFVKDQATCRGYFYCRDLGSGVPDVTPTWGECTGSKFFDETRQVCSTRTEVGCSEDRCDGRTKGFELSPRTGCQHYLKCENGVTIAELKCEGDKYFDPINEECVETKQAHYSICSGEY